YGCYEFFLPDRSFPSPSFLNFLETTQFLSRFPTRRSSDLGGHEEQPGLRERETQPRDDRRYDRGQLHGREQTRPVVAVRPPELEDRKSTRLNSSHVKISYAVFCLKKIVKCYGNIYLLHGTK